MHLLCLIFYYYLYTIKIHTKKMLYIHIPICTAKCHYCSFYSLSSGSVNREKLIEALCGEIASRADLHSEPLDTIYFGGGTPSVLSKVELQQIFNTINANYNTSQIEEITLEANPDHLTIEFLLDIKELGVNRLSIGVQSFNNTRLKTLGRRHTAQQAVDAVERARRVGFDNISVDLMFGFSDLSYDEWRASIQSALELGVQHISAYQLTIEDGSKFAYYGVKCADDQVCFEQYMTLCQQLTSAGFEHYEISNFALPEHRSKHNSGYWQGKKYIGIGPSAHSYDGARSRSWNVSDVFGYFEGKLPTSEDLSSVDLHNEYIMTRLRQSAGFDVLEYQRLFKRELAQVEGLQVENGRAFIEEEYLFVSDGIMAELFA